MVQGQQRACMPVYIGKSGDLAGCYRCLTHWQTSEYRATQLLSSKAESRNDASSDHVCAIGRRASQCVISALGHLWSAQVTLYRKLIWRIWKTSPRATRQDMFQGASTLRGLALPLRLFEVQRSFWGGSSYKHHGNDKV